MAYSDFSTIDCVEYHQNFLPNNIYKDAFNNILKEAIFLSDEDASIILGGKKVKIPRKQCGYGNEGLGYRYNGKKVKAKRWEESATLEKIKDFIKEELKIPITYVLVNLYRNGEDYISYHSDDERDLDPNYPILSLTLGAERPFRFQNKLTKKTYEQVLHDNSIVIMNHPCQKIYKHSLPKKPKDMYGSRINLTFRVIKSKN